MPLVASALMPNSPLLLPKLAAVVQKRVNKTRQAIDRLSQELYARQPSIIIMVGYSLRRAEVCSLLQSPKLNYSFAAWGDVITRGQVLIATGFTHHLKESAEVNFPIKLQQAESLPINFAVPVNSLATHFSNVPFVFLQLPEKISLDDLTRLSNIIKEASSNSNERIALLAVGDLAEQNPKVDNEARIYDKYFQSALKPLNTQALADLAVDLKNKVQESLLGPALLQALVLKDLAVETELLSYEAPAKVGYVVAQFSWS